MTQIFTVDNFDRELKRLIKKYPSLRAALGELIEELQENPTIGTPLGNNIYKIRLAISSKNRGKSGGARLITYFITEDNELYLISIYDKSEQADISDKLLTKLIHNLIHTK